MFANFLLYIKEKALFAPSQRLLLTVSGGIDSIVLIELCHQAGLNFGIAHCNFQLRGDESDGDEQFVQQLALDYKVDFYVQKFETALYAQQHGISTQMAARNLRYEWFEKLRSAHHYDYVLTAHHQDDLLETVLLNLTRGTGLAGLHGILPKNGFLIRPLLFATRKDIEAFVQKHQLSWREDSSNATNDYLRNRLRHEVVPVLQAMNPKVASSVAELAERISAIEQILKESIEETAKQFIQEKQGALWIAYAPFGAFSSPIERLSFWLAKYGFNYQQVKNIWKNQGVSVGKQFFSATHILIADRDHWIITPTAEEQPLQYLLQENEQEKRYPNGQLEWQYMEAADHQELENKPNVVYLDASLLQFPLVLRPWKTGDWFCPLGMNGKRKKISDFLIDHKVPRHQKKQVYVLTSDDKIIWLIGFRADDRFKITLYTKKYVKFFLN